MTHPTPLRFTETASRETSVPLFRVLLCEFRECRGMSQAEMGRRAGLTNSYVSRLEGGRSVRPARETVAAIADALSLNTYDRDALLMSAGFAPPAMNPLDIDPVIGRLASVLADPSIPADVREGIREMLWQVVRIVPRGEAVAS